MTKKTMSVQQAIEILDRATDHPDPHWMNCVEDWYCEDTDTWPTFYDVLHALGVYNEDT